MKHYLGGYFIVEQTRRSDYMSKDLLPDFIFTPSNCICNLHPDSHCLSWVRKDVKEINGYQKRIKLPDDDFNSLCQDCNKYFEENKYGWVNMFLDLECLHYIKNKYFNNIDNLKILAISTTQQYMDDFLQEETPPENHGESGVYTMLKIKEEIDIQKKFRGYEILGFEYGSFHSFICNGLEKELNGKLGINFNSNGLIDNYKDACKAAEHVNNSGVGAEPVLWQPWAINEI